MSKLQKYTLYYKLYLIISILLTKCFYPQARLIRFPFNIRNKKNINIGKNFTSGHCCRLESLPENIPSNHKTIIIGDNVEINDFVHIAALQSVKIGNGVLIASKVYISDINHGCFDSNVEYDINVPPQQQPLSAKPVILENNVWLGESVCVLPGVKIGEGAVIGAMSVVSKDIPPYSIAVGVPAKVVKMYNSQTKCWEKNKA